MSKLSPAVTGILAAASLILSACQAVTPVSTTAPMPTVVISTPLPAATSAPQHPEARPDAATRLDFSSTTMLSFPGDLKPNAAIQAVFKGEAGQKIAVNTSYESSNRGVLSLWGADGAILIPEVAGVSKWDGKLPSAQDYYLNLRNTAREPLTYRVTIKLPPLAQPSATRIQFQPNSTGGTTQGDLAPQARLRYVLGVASGQTMTVSLITASPDIDAYLYIWSADGTVYTLAAPVKDWSGRLPATQDYYIELVSASDQPLSYQLSINIPPSIPTLKPAPTSQTKIKIAVDQPIRFSEGALSVEFEGKVAGGQRDRYTFNAKGGESLDIKVTSTEGDAAFTIIGPDDSPLPGTEEEKNIDNLSVTLPVEGTYSILVGPTHGNTTYVLSVKIKN